MSDSPHSDPPFKAGDFLQIREGGLVLHVDRCYFAGESWCVDLSHDGLRTMEAMPVSGLILVQDQTDTPSSFVADITPSPSEGPQPDPEPAVRRTRLSRNKIVEQQQVTPTALKRTHANGRVSYKCSACKFARSSVPAIASHWGQKHNGPVHRQTYGGKPTKRVQAMSVMDAGPKVPTFNWIELTSAASDTALVAQIRALLGAAETGPLQEQVATLTQERDQAVARAESAERGLRAFKDFQSALTGLG